MHAAGHEQIVVAPTARGKYRRAESVLNFGRCGVLVSRWETTMSVELTRATPDHAPALGKIFWDAFEGISKRHGFPMDVPDLHVANMLMTSITTRPDYYGVSAIENGRIVGCNFAQLSDAVSGVGPICIDPAAQSRGIGRKLMGHIVEWSLKNHGPMVRLMQDSFNMTSLSLYTSLGFTVQEPMVLMEVQPAASGDGAIRPLAAVDIMQADDLTRRIYKVSRRNELAMMIQEGPAAGATPHGSFRHGELEAFLIPGFLGFGVGKSDSGLLALAQHIASVSPPHAHRLFVPARRGDMDRDALKRGFKSLKVMQLMSIGPFETPEGAWCSSVAY
jgi:GNAT superfamily N-acetyltransferase